MKASEQKQQEAIRDRVYDPVTRWQHLQDRITWAEQNVVHRNTPANRVAEQRRKCPDRAPPASPS